MNEIEEYTLQLLCNRNQMLRDRPMAEQDSAEMELCSQAISTLYTRSKTDETN